MEHTPTWHSWDCTWVAASQRRPQNRSCRLQCLFPSSTFANSLKAHRNTNINKYLPEAGCSFFFLLPAAGPPPTTDFRSVWAGLFDHPGSEENLSMCHSFMCFLGALQPPRSRRVSAWSASHGHGQSQLYSRSLFILLLSPLPPGGSGGVSGTL